MQLNYLGVKRQLEGSLV